MIINESRESKILNSLNENKSVNLTSQERSAIRVAVGSDARAGIVEAKDVIKALDRVKNDKVNFSSGDIEFLQYWNDLLKNHPTSPKAKYMDDDLKSALNKIF